MIIEVMDNNDMKIATMGVAIKGMAKAIPRTFPNVTLISASED
jgi:hypothetical protein